MKRIFKPFIQPLLTFTDRHPTFYRYCVTLTRAIGLYGFLYKLNQQSQSDGPYKPDERTLTPHEQRVYKTIKDIIKAKGTRSLAATDSAKKRLAYISPLPPQRSGISNYSASLLPLLAENYDIEVIVDQNTLSDSWIKNNCIIRSGDWFKKHSSTYDRVIYHFGNAPFHKYMFDLLEEVPGLVILHDFFLGHVAQKQNKESFGNYLYRCHGYNAVEDLHNSGSREAIIWTYPLNLSVLQGALNVIVHSSYSQRLAKQFYGDDVADNWSIIPLLRLPSRSLDRTQSRTILKFAPDDFIICSFGLTGQIKLNHRLIDAWLSSDLAQNKNCVLVFVGENDRGDYGDALLACIQECGLNDRIHITGWLNEDSFHHYLAAADIGVQLRTRSRGETSAALLDCMNYGLATIVNANGAMAEFPDNAVYLLNDDFDDLELTHAIETLWRDESYRQRLAAKAKEILATLHSPASCVSQYVTAIESAYDNRQIGLHPFLEAIAQFDEADKTDAELKQLAQTIARTNQPHIRQKQLLIDISGIVIHDLKTGIQRVVRAQLEVLLRHHPTGVRIEPVYLSNQGGRWHYQYARGWTIQFLDIAHEMRAEDTPVEFYAGDILFCADLHALHATSAGNELLYQNLMSSGIKVFFQVFDLLPITHPEWFPAGAKSTHLAWAKVAANSNGAICISNTVAEEFKTCCDDYHLQPEQISFFHLGAEINTTSSSMGLPEDADDILIKLTSTPSFLMVGTVEPRKGYLQILAAFEILWQQGLDINLVIVGKSGWFVTDFINKLGTHQENGHRLFWLGNISDEFLKKVYHSCSCLIAASEGEGFGLPLIEAAQHKLPIIARDIPVFREVAGRYAYYFEGLDASSLANTINQWLDLDSKGENPGSADMPWLTWRESTEQLIKILGLDLSG